MAVNLFAKRHHVLKRSPNIFCNLKICKYFKLDAKKTLQFAFWKKNAEGGKLDIFGFFFENRK